MAVLTMFIFCLGSCALATPDPKTPLTEAPPMGYRLPEITKLFIIKIFHLMIIIIYKINSFGCF